MTSETQAGAGRQPPRPRRRPASSRVIPYSGRPRSASSAGLYIAWRKGSAGGRGAVRRRHRAARRPRVVRLVLPARLVGLLGTRKRVTDVLTLTVFGVGLIVAGLVLPR